MCEKCVEIDKTIERYRRIQRSVTDPSTIAAAEQLITECEADKVALHLKLDGCQG